MFYGKFLRKSTHSRSLMKVCRQTVIVRAVWHHDSPSQDPQPDVHPRPQVAAPQDIVPTGRRYVHPPRLTIPWNIPELQDPRLSRQPTRSAVVHTQLQGRRVVCQCRRCINLSRPRRPPSLEILELVILVICASIFTFPYVEFAVWSHGVSRPVFVMRLDVELILLIMMSVLAGVYSYSLYSHHRA